ncbi:MAG: phosphoribosyltransferase family protein [Pseudomonadota bacterium]
MSTLCYLKKLYKQRSIDCVLCGGLATTFLCAACAGSLPRPKARQLALIKHVAVLYPYCYPLTSVIQQMKYRGEFGLARNFGMLLGEQCATQWPSTAQLVPVPSGRVRLLTRGFNQAFEIALGIQRISQAPIENTMLRRRSRRPRQSTLSRQARLANARNLYYVKSNLDEGHRTPLVLVDDVTTTGASLCAAARVLKDAGFSEIYAACVASAD